MGRAIASLKETDLKWKLETEAYYAMEPVEFDESIFSILEDDEDDVEDREITFLQFVAEEKSVARRLKINREAIEDEKALTAGLVAHLDAEKRLNEFWRKNIPEAGKAWPKYFDSKRSNSEKANEDEAESIYLRDQGQCYIPLRLRPITSSKRYTPY